MEGRSHGARDEQPHEYDAVLYISFGGPEAPDDVMPFLENVTRGRGVPRERLLEVAEHYRHFGGVSPINAENRKVIAALEHELARRGPTLPVYWGNRNWYPLLTDTIAQMQRDGVRRAVGFVTSAWSSYSGCRQYREDISRAREAAGPAAPEVDKIRQFFNHPGFIEAQADQVNAALASISEPARPGTHLLFTAHSIPQRMADSSSYVEQLGAACRLVDDRVDGSYEWSLAYQSRSGPPHIPWLEPDVAEHLEKLASEGLRDVVVVPIGFLSDHMEVRFDLDVEAAAVARKRGLNMVRAETVGAHPAYVAMIRDLIVERLEGSEERPALGELGASHDICAADCCRY
ncbi:MAG TPA: ferrochelatase [Actinomycetota bacterium]|nr:ferrochelatase [Actinomycetota bacterium]